jgi:hypothetical protein
MSRIYSASSSLLLLSSFIIIFLTCACGEKFNYPLEANLEAVTIQMYNDGIPTDIGYNLNNIHIKEIYSKIKNNGLFSPIHYDIVEKVSEMPHKTIKIALTFIEINGNRRIVFFSENETFCYIQENHSVWRTEKYPKSCAFQELKFLLTLDYSETKNIILKNIFNRDFTLLPIYNGAGKAIKVVRRTRENNDFYINATEKSLIFKKINNDTFVTLIATGDSIEKEFTYIINTINIPIKMQATNIADIRYVALIEYTDRQKIGYWYSYKNGEKIIERDDFDYYCTLTIIDLMTRESIVIANRVSELTAVDQMVSYLNNCFQFEKCQHELRTPLENDNINLNPVS